MKITEDLMECIVRKLKGQEVPSTFNLIDVAMLGGDQKWRLIFWFKCEESDIVRTHVVHQKDFKEVWPE